MGEEDSTAAAEEDFMQEGEVAAAFTEVEVPTPEATLRTACTAADATTAGMVVVATTEGAAITEDITEAEVITAGAEDIGEEGTVTDGDLALDGHIGVTDGDTPIPTTARGITRPTLIIPTRITVLRAIPRPIRILTAGMTILHHQIPTRHPSPTRTGPQNPGARRYRQAQPTRPTQTTISRPLRRVVRCSPLTG